MVHAGKNEWQVSHYFLYQHSALHHFCATVSFTSPNETRKERNITELKPLGHSEIQNIGSCTYVDGFTVNTTVKVIWNSQHINETNITTFTIKHSKFL